MKLNKRILTVRNALSAKALKPNTSAMKETLHIKGSLVWQWGRSQRGHYIAVCDPIGQTVQADKFSELLESISEVVNSTFRELLSTGDLEQFLRDRGWKSESPLPSRQKNVRFDMPFDLTGVNTRDFKATICS
jgi:hypothetical protein